MYSCIYVACTQCQGHGFIYSSGDYEDDARINIMTRQLLRSAVYQSAMPHRFSDQIECSYVNDLPDSDLPKANQWHKDDVA